MTIKRTSALGSVAHRIRRTWDELSYAQRRSFELRTGISAGRPAHGLRTRDEHRADSI